MRAPPDAVLPTVAPRRTAERTLESIGMRNEALRAQFQQVGDGLALMRTHIFWTWLAVWDSFLA